ncbi:hypothetical protein GA0111570_10465 [Raineyella antarctica]|uniref:Uncharacterized protein n=1 Tax=Raineyella antarctica TaxID=1577474 RepID=A0A1G6GLM9_9ACTN|nr:hypothetical protein [Raineyella antarctica]SDB82918.1 hypothetical protein GA0111570_10465 [Raineyella antarctica]
MSTAVERTRFGWSRWAESSGGLERSYTICAPGLSSWRRDVVHVTLFRDDRRGIIQLAARWLVRGLLVALVLGGVLALILQSSVVLIPVTLSVLVAAAVVLAALPNFGRQVAERHTITVTGDACREVCRIAAVLDRIEPDPSDVERDDARTMWRLAHTDPKFLHTYGRTVRDWELSYDRLRATLARDGSTPTQDVERRTGILTTDVA